MPARVLALCSVCQHRSVLLLWMSKSSQKRSDSSGHRKLLGGSLGIRRNRLHSIWQKSREASSCFGGVRVDLEQAVGARQLQHHACLPRRGRQLQIAIALHYLRNTPEQHFDTRGIELLYLRQIEDKLRTV